MFKKCLSLIVCICVTLSCVTFATTTVSAADEVIISDYFSSNDYEYIYNSEQEGYELVTYKSGVTNPGTGWQGKWLSDLSGSEIGTGEKGKVYTYGANGATDATNTRTLRVVNYDGTVYRKFGSPIALSDAGEYIIRFRFSDGTSTAANRKGDGFRFLIGDSFSVGYEWITPENADPTQTKSFLTVGDDTVYSQSGQDTTGAWNASFKEIIVSLAVGASGTDDTVKVKMIDEDSSSKVWDIERTVNLSGEISYFGITDLSKSSSVRIDDIEITKIDTERKALADQVRAEMPGYDAVTRIDAITDETLRSELIAEYNTYGFAYDKMDNARYANKYTSTTGRDTLGLKWGTESSITIDGGAGWSGAWQHDRYQGSSGTYYPNAYITAKSDISNYISDMGDYAMLINGAGGDAYDKITRNLNTPVDLGVDGEYYVKFNGTWNVYNSSSSFDTNMKFEVALGDTISFGNECINDGSKNIIVPIIKTGIADYNKISAITIPSRDYYDYILRIVSSATGDDSYELYVCDAGTFNSATEPVSTGTFSSDNKLTSISMKATSKQFCVGEIAVECFNASVTGNPFKPDTVRSNIAAADSADAAQAVADALPKCVAAKYLQATALDNCKHLYFEFFQFDKGTMATPITTLDNYYDSSKSDNKLRATFVLKNNSESRKDINVFFVVYDGDEFKAVTKNSYNIQPAARCPEATDKYVYGSLTDAFIPAGLTNPVVKLFVWDYNTMEPYLVKTIQATYVDSAES